MPTPRIDNQALQARCLPIELLVLDVDGVLTDGVIALDDQGVETKHFHVRDGAGISFWRYAGKKVAILSGRTAQVVNHRAAELGITPVIQGASKKQPRFLELLEFFQLKPDQAAFMGDDLADLAPMSGAGLAACPADAALEVQAAAHLVTSSPGGRGAVRELVEYVLKAQDRWEALVESQQGP